MIERWLEEASFEIEEVIRYYALRDPGEEGRFVHYLSNGVEEVMKNPTQPREFDPPFRRSFLKVFPHQLIYVVEGETVIFVAVAHPSMRKGYWKERY